MVQPPAGIEFAGGLGVLRSIYHRAPPDLFRSAMTTNVVVSVGDARKCVTCAPGMLVNELRYVLGAAFDVDDAAMSSAWRVVGVPDLALALSRKAGDAEAVAEIEEAIARVDEQFASQVWLFATAAVDRSVRLICCSSCR